MAGRTYRYSVAAVDGTGRASAASAPAVVTVPYSLWDGFETGSLGKWLPNGAVAVHRGIARTGSYAVVATSTGRPASAARTIPALAAGVDFDVDFRVASQGSGSVLLQVLRTPSGTPVLGTKRRDDGRLALYDYATGIGRIAPGSVRVGAWHHLTLSVDLAGAGSSVVVTLDGRQVARLTGAHTLPDAAIGSVQVGDDRPGRAFDVAFDDVEVQTPA
jgi:antitoxin (DNA-binding transcriptional repressor) of toxin-antitoxin stability system